MPAKLKAKRKELMMSQSIMAALASVALTTTAFAAPGAGIQPGKWRTEDGTATVRIANCSGVSTQCATVIEERLQPGETSSLGQTLVRDIRPNGKKGWAGKFVADGQSMNAKITQTGPGKMKMKICAMAFLCDSIGLVKISD
jgi:uncharacterized protein (DUF2147 family)